jgi:hypothetical protein
MLGLQQPTEVIMKRSLLAIAGLVAFLGIAAIADAQSPPTQPRGPVATGPNFVDANGDGLCDQCPAGKQPGGQRGKAGAGRGAGNGPQDGTGNQGVGPRDGTGFGSGKRPGTCAQCDGTGPKGTRRGPRR